MAEYKLGRRARACMACEREFEDGATIVSAVREKSGEFLRRDVCEACFLAEGEEGCYSFWRGRHPPAPTDPHRLDYSLARTFLERLVREADPSREGLTYVLTLLLSRKRRLKIRETRRLPAGELFLVDLPGPEEDERIEVRVPRLGEGEEERLQSSLQELFGIE